MGVPKNRKSKANVRMHRGGLNANNTAPALSICPQCRAFKQPHHACPECGYYKGRLVDPATAAAQK